MMDFEVLSRLPILNFYVLGWYATAALEPLQRPIGCEAKHHTAM